MAQPDYPNVKYGPEDRQFVDIYVAPSNEPTPVYFDAHGNNGNTNMPNAIIQDLKAAGISTVAWESLTTIGTQDEVDIGWADAELMFAWVKANAETYNFDTTNFIIGGSSRGSILSWKYGHRPDPNTRGLYMYNALPDGIWQDSTSWYPPNEVTVESPPIFFVYRWEPNHPTDIHDPENGMIIMDRYDALGIGDRDTMVHSIEYSDNQDKYQFLVDFVLSVIETNPILNTNTQANQRSSLRVFPNPFRSAFEISGLQGGEYFTLTSAHGQTLLSGYTLDPHQINRLSSGVYFLSVQTNEAREVLTVIKSE